MTSVPSDELTPERKAKVFRDAVIQRLQSVVDEEPLSEAESNYVQMMEEAVSGAADAIVETLERVAPND